MGQTDVIGLALGSAIYVVDVLTCHRQYLQKMLESYAS